MQRRGCLASEQRRARRALQQAQHSAPHLDAIHKAVWLHSQGPPRGEHGRDVSIRLGHGSRVRSRAHSRVASADRGRSSGSASSKAARLQQSCSPAVVAAAARCRIQGSTWPKAACPCRRVIRSTSRRNSYMQTRQCAIVRRQRVGLQTRGAARARSWRNAIDSRIGAVDRCAVDDADAVRRRRRCA